MTNKKFLTMTQIADAISAPEFAARIIVARTFADLPVAYVKPKGAKRVHKGYEVFSVVEQCQQHLKYYSDNIAAKLIASAMPAVREVKV